MRSPINIDTSTMLSCPMVGFSRAKLRRPRRTDSAGAPLVDSSNGSGAVDVIAAQPYPLLATVGHLEPPMFIVAYLFDWTIAGAAVEAVRHPLIMMIGALSPQAS